MDDGRCIFGYITFEARGHVAASHLRAPPSQTAAAGSIDASYGDCSIFAWGLGSFDPTVSNSVVVHPPAVGAEMT